MSKLPMKSPFGVAAKEKYIDDLPKYSMAQLLEMRERQMNLLANKSRLNKLADKGVRIQSLFDRIVNEIRSRNELDEAAAIFSDLNIADHGLKTITHMEWSGGKANGTDHLDGPIVDSDDDDDVSGNPLKLIAQSRTKQKIVKVEAATPSLITAADLEEINSFSNNTLEPHAVYKCTKDKSFDENSNRKKFLPHRTTVSNVHSVDKEKLRKQYDVTAATPPTMRNNEAKVLSLHESIEVERKYKNELKQMQEKQAEERLVARQKLISDNISLLPVGIDLSDPNKLFETYREQGARADDDSDRESSIDENSDDGEERETGGVTVVAYD